MVKLELVRDLVKCYFKNETNKDIFNRAYDNIWRSTSFLFVLRRQYL